MSTTQSTLPSNQQTLNPKQPTLISNQPSFKSISNTISTNESTLISDQSSLISNQPTLIKNDQPPLNKIQNTQQNIQKPETIISQTQVQAQVKKYLQQKQGTLKKDQNVKNEKTNIITFQKPVISSKPEQQISNAQNNDNIKCSCGRPSNYICIQRQCQNYAFFCEETEQSACKNNLHMNCFKISLKTFKEKIQAKILDVQQLNIWHQKIVQQFLKKINEQAQKMRKQFQIYAQQTYQFWNLTASQKQAWNKIEKNDVKNLKGEYFWKMIMEMNEKIQQNKNCQDISVVKNKWSSNWKHLQYNFRQQLLKFQSQIAKINQNHQDTKFSSSSIIQTDQQIKIVHSYFNKKIEKVSLLYKATQNEFKLDKFYQNCSGISNTIIFIQTASNKKVGGFTSHYWKKVEKQQFLEDLTNTSFIFSITNNQKLNKRKQSQSGIWNYKNYGPIFGQKFGVWDIAIQSEANKADCMIGSNYGFGNSALRNADTIQKFNGNKNNDQFCKLKQWQVWQIKFQFP